MHINYKKKFIILKNKYSNLRGYKAKGHMKLEIKGAHININLNVEKAEADSCYSLVLVSEDIIELGKIYTDSYGSCKAELILKTEDFLQGELDQGAIVLHRDQNVLLGEYLDKEDGKLEEYIQSLSYLEEEVHYPEPEHEPVIEEEPIIEAEPVIEVEPIIEAKEPEQVQEPEEPQEPQYQEYPDLEYEYNLRKMEQTTNYILSILRYFPYAEPFIEELENYNWWRIDYNGEVEEGFLPYFNYIVSDASIGLMQKYGHYLFGLCNEGNEGEEVKYYIYGVPGEYSLEEHPNNGEPGFEKWYEGKEQVGYWLLYIDPLTGQPVEPS